MTVSSWRGLADGIRGHHHCLATVEWSTDDKHWTDASTAKPDLVSWHAGEIMTWMLDQMKAHVEDADEIHGRKAWLEDAIASYVPFEQAASLSKDRVPTRWEYAAAVLPLGRWMMPTFGLSFRKTLVMQILSFADHDQPEGNYVICKQHARSAA